MINFVCPGPCAEQSENIYSFGLKKRTWNQHLKVIIKDTNSGENLYSGYILFFLSAIVLNVNCAVVLSNKCVFHRRDMFSVVQCFALFQTCNIDADCGKDRCCIKFLGICAPKRGIDESCNFSVRRQPLRTEIASFYIIFDAVLLLKVSQTVNEVKAVGWPICCSVRQLISLNIKGLILRRYIFTIFLFV